MLQNRRRQRFLDRLSVARHSDPAAFRATARAAVRSFPADPEIRMALATAVLASGDRVGAAEESLAAAGLPGANPTVLVRAAFNLVAVARLDAATSLLDRLDQMDAVGALVADRATYLRGLIAMETGNDADAERSLRAAAFSKPTDPFYVFALAKFLVDRDRSMEAGELVALSEEIDNPAVNDIMVRKFRSLGLT